MACVFDVIMPIKDLIYTGWACAVCAELKQSQLGDVSPSLLQKMRITLGSLILMRVLLAFAACSKVTEMLVLTCGNNDFISFFKSLWWGQMFGCCGEGGRFSRFQCGDFKVNPSSGGSKMCSVWLAGRMAFSWSFVPVPECFFIWWRKYARFSCLPESYCSHPVFLIPMLTFLMRLKEKVSLPSHAQLSCTVASFSDRVCSETHPFFSSPWTI